MKTHSTLRTAFTLVEMLVVIAIISVLASALIGKYGQIQENGWSTRCKANLKNLYQATLNYENDNGQEIPCAGSYEVQEVITGHWQERQGWVRWIPLSGTTWPDWSDGQSHAAQMHPQDGTYPLWYGAEATLSLSDTNHTLWEYTSNQGSAYLCPRFARKSFCGRSDARRSYVMNGFFNCTDPGWAGWWRRNIQNNLSNKDPSRVPLFCDGGNDRDVKNDGVLHLTGGNTVKGFMCVHKIGGHLQGQVVYLDGHVTATTNLSYAACTGDE